MTSQLAESLPTGLLIGSDWIFETTAGTMDHISPTTGLVQRAFPIAGPSEVDAAVAAARAALPGWRAWSPNDRRDVLRRLAGLMRAYTDEFGTIGALETGLLKTLANYFGVVAADWFDYYAGWADKLQGDVINIPGSFNYTVPEPIGVAAILITWNGPAGAVGMTCAAPLAAGCTIVLKAPELSPFSSSLFGRLCLEAGLPSGVVNVIVGGPAAGDALVRHPGIDKIGFTGSPATAKRIQAAAAESLTPLLLELGGKSANLVFADADIDRAVAASTMGICMLNGQTCIAPTRLLVQDSVYDRVANGVAAAMASIKVGDPMDPSSGMGPVINRGARDRIASMIESARTSGSGEMLAGSEPLDPDLGGGFFVAPTVFGGIDNRSPIAQNEIFGPVLAIIKFSDEDEAIALANDTTYGLAAYLHTSDVARTHRLAAALDAGNIAVNGGNPSAGPHAPFGGFKQSGYGKEGGYLGVLEFVRTKNVNINVL